MTDIKVLVATHKKYRMPTDSMYLPIHVGCEGKKNLGYQGDNTGYHISEKNSSWCELTALYWGWQNLNCEYIGLVQYRRHFRGRNKGRTIDSVLTKMEALRILENTDIILPKKRNYWWDTLRKHFEDYDFSDENDLKLLQEILEEFYPEYVSAFENVMNWHKGHMCNMFIMKKSLADQFCKWEFHVLEEFEHRINIDRKRMIGYLAEHMLDIWIAANNLSYQECDVVLPDFKNEIDRRIDYIMRKLRLPFRRIKLG